MKFVSSILFMLLLVSCTSSNQMAQIKQKGGFVPAEPIEVWEPEYPKQAAIDGIEGYVVVLFDVSKSGTIENARVIKSEPKVVFDYYALKVLEKWKFRPAQQNGKNVMQSNLEYNIVFKL